MFKGAKLFPLDAVLLTIIATMKFKYIRWNIYWKKKCFFFLFSIEKSFNSTEWMINNVN